MLGFTKQEQGIALFLIFALVVGSLFTLYNRYFKVSNPPQIDADFIGQFQKRGQELEESDVASGPISARSKEADQIAMSSPEPTTPRLVRKGQTAEAGNVRVDQNHFLVNINSADQKELERIPRVGPSTAQKIIDFRLANGAFTSIDQLTRVKGIGKATLERIRPYITIN